MASNRLIQDIYETAVKQQFTLAAQWRKTDLQYTARKAMKKYRVAGWRKKNPRYIVFPVVSRNIHRVSDREIFDI